VRVRLGRLATAVVCATGIAACGTTANTAGVQTGANAGLSVPTIAPSAGAGAGPAGRAGTTGSAPIGVVPGPTGTTGGTGPRAATSTGTGAAGAAGRTGPIKIGFMYTVNDAAQSAGVNNNTSINPGNVMRALVASYNDRGGFAGRRIDPVYAFIRSSSNNFEGDLAAACATFTQDNHVVAVLSTMGLYSESFFACLAKAGVPVISGDAGPDVSDAHAFPLLVTPDSMLGDTRVTEVVDRLHAAGWLTSRDRMGVVIENCPINKRIYANALAPELRRLGIPVAATAEPHCFQAIGDLGTISAEMGSAVVQFRQRGVSKVIFVSQAQEGTIAYEFMLAAGNQGWYPGYALSSSSLATTLQSQSGVPEREFSNARGVGWAPPTDTVKRDQWTTTPTTRECLQRVRAHGLRPSTATDDLQVETVCDTFLLYDAALRATHGDASATAVQTGLHSVASSFVSSYCLSGATAPWDHGRLAPAAGRLFDYESSQGGFVYTGRSFRFAG
jgi:hypothetical protein